MGYNINAKHENAVASEAAIEGQRGYDNVNVKHSKLSKLYYKHRFPLHPNCRNIIPGNTISFSFSLGMTDLSEI